MTTDEHNLEAEGESVRRRSFMRALALLTLRGLSAILPVSVALFFIFWLASTAEHLLGGLLKKVLPPQIYLPGMGLVTGLVLVIGVGLLFNIWLFQRLAATIEGWLARLPLVRTLLGGIKDLMAFLIKGQGAFGKGSVVQVEYGNGIKMIGIMTRQNLNGTSVESIGSDHCAIYLPLSYQMGGVTVYVPYSKITPINVSVEDAFRFAFTAGMSDENRPIGRGVFADGGSDAGAQNANSGKQ